MTSMSWKKDRRVRIIAGGRENWQHDPDRCDIEYVRLEKKGLVLKASAGGYERGIAIRWELDKEFILESYAKIVGIEGSKTAVIEGLISHLVSRHKEILLEKVAIVAVKDAGFGPKTTKTLLDAGIVNLGDLANLTEQKLLETTSLGTRSLRRVRAVLMEFGLQLSE